MTNADYLRADLRAAIAHLRTIIAKDQRPSRSQASERIALGSMRATAAYRVRMLVIAVAILGQPDPFDCRRMRFGITTADLRYAMDAASRRYGTHPALLILDVHATRNRTPDARVAARLARDALNMNPAFRRRLHA